MIQPCLRLLGEDYYILLHVFFSFSKCFNLLKMSFTSFLIILLLICFYPTERLSYGINKFDNDDDDDLNMDVIIKTICNRLTA